MPIEKAQTEKYFADMMKVWHEAQVPRDFRAVCIAVLSVTPITEETTDFRHGVVDSLHSSIYRPPDPDAQYTNWEQLNMNLERCFGHLSFDQLPEWAKAPLAVGTASMSPEDFEKKARLAQGVSSPLVDEDGDCSCCGLHVDPDTTHECPPGFRGGKHG